MGFRGRYLRVMDHTNVYDHPAVLLDGYAENAKKSEAEFGMQVGASAAFSAAASLLRQYQDDKGVIFAALDLGALAEMQEIRTALSNSGGLDPKYDGLIADLQDTLRDLFGDEDPDA